MKKINVIITASLLFLFASCGTDTKEQDETVGQHVDTAIHDVKTKTQETKEDMKDAGSDAKASMKEGANDAKEGVKGAANDVKEGVNDAYHDTKKAAEKVDEKAKDIKDDLKKK